MSSWLLVMDLVGESNTSWDRSKAAVEQASSGNITGLRYPTLQPVSTRADFRI